MLEHKVYIKASASISAWDLDFYSLENLLSKPPNTFQKNQKSFYIIDENYQKEVDLFLNEYPKYKKLDRSVQFILFLGDKMKNIPSNTALNISSSRGASNLWEDQYKNYLSDKKISVFTSPNTTLGNVSSHLSNHLNTKHINISHSITCSSSLHGFANAFAWLKSGMAKQFLVGSTESCISGFSLHMFEKLKIYSPYLDKYPCKPFEKNKEFSSMVLGEGAGLFLLDTDENNSIAEIEGIGYATEEFKHPADISDTGEGYLESMNMAIGDIPKEKIDLILMHAPGTIKGDNAELKACSKFNKNTATFSTKFLFGHSLGASGALNIAFALKLFKEKAIQLKYPYQNSGKEINLTNCKRILINTSGFGGNTISVLLKKTTEN